MCGFVGFTRSAKSQDETADRQLIQKMTHCIQHRGPDDQGVFLDDAVAMGFCRLSIIDLAHGHQPMKNEQGMIQITFNGEIYNFDSLREKLIRKGHRFHTKCDTETLIHAYEEYGVEMLQMIRGMFSFVIYDKKNNKLFGARDIFGIKPFYYYHTKQNPDMLLYGSEIKAFLPHPAFDKRLNEQRLPDYLCFEYIPTHETLFQDVYKLPAGHYFEYQNGQLQVSPYHTMRYQLDENKTLDDWAQEIGMQFENSCDAHAIADVEVGCFLSSGVDSSLVTEKMKSYGDIKTFSVGYAEEKYSELSHVREFSGTLGVENHSFTITADDFFEAVPTVQYHMDEPLPNPSALPLYFLTKHAAEHVKVVLSGEGADELFGGYAYYQECLVYQRYQKLTPLLIRKMLSGAAKPMPNFHGKRFLLRGALPIEKRYIRNNYVYHADEREHILVKSYAAKKPEEYTKPIFDRVKGQDEVTKMQFADLHTWLVYDILQKADKMSMANSLELRVPFLDKYLLDIAMRIPSRYRVGEKMTKIALREYARKKLPEKTAVMRKRGFPVPLNDWLKQDKYYQMVREKLSGDVSRKFFQVDYILKMLDDHAAGKIHAMKRIWSLYTFIVWYEEYFIKR